MTNEKAVFVFSPGENHLRYIEPVLDSIVKNLTVPYQFCVLLPAEKCGLQSKYPILKKVISESDLKKCEDWYWQEGRADIPPFAAYAQLFIPTYFSEFPALLFMEVDQIVKGDLASLWRQCLHENIKLGAVRSQAADGSFGFADSFKRLHPAGRYYNMGVVFVNTKAWNDLDFSVRCIEELLLQKKQRGWRLEFYTQGAMNNALHEYVTDLDYRYNVTGLGYKEDILEDHLKSGVILHWSGSRKPWCRNGLYKEYYYNNYSRYHAVRDKVEDILVTGLNRIRAIGGKARRILLGSETG